MQQLRSLQETDLIILWIEGLLLDLCFVFSLFPHIWLQVSTAQKSNAVSSNDREKNDNKHMFLRDFALLYIIHSI